MSKITSSLEPLRPLDLTGCSTVGDVVDGMSRCSFGARMLGEVAAKLSDWCSRPQKPLLIYDGRMETPLGQVILDMFKKGWFEKIIRPDECWALRWPYYKNGLVVGSFSERHAPALFDSPDGTVIYVNKFDLAKPGQIRDGYFPDAVFADPNFIMPVLRAVLLERLRGIPSTVSELIDEQLSGSDGVGAQIRNGARTLLTMMEDRGCRRFLTLSGAMTVAQMSLVICDMIDRGMVHSVTSTGALMAHGLVPGLGLKHYKYSPADDDRRLAAMSLNRVTDTLEPETNFDHIDDILHAVLDTFTGEEPISPRLLNRVIGKFLAEHYPEHRAILRSAWEKNVPVFVPAFIDSELGNDVYVSNCQRQIEGKRRVIFDLEADNAELVRLMTEAERAGIWTFGGGVPRNWTQNVSPLLEIYNSRLNRLGRAMPIRKFRYGCKVCPDRPHFGHLGGCTYEEGKSWRKFEPDGIFAEIQADATQVWPLLVKYVMEWQDRRAA